MTDLHLESGDEILAVRACDSPDEADDALTVTIERDSAGSAVVSYACDATVHLTASGHNAVEVTLASAPSSGRVSGCRPC